MGTRNLLALLALSFTAQAGDFEQAAELYDAGKFNGARELYGKLVERGDWRANVFYNLGDTEFRLGAPGRAALNFERALAVDPGHPEANRNLRLVRERTGAHIEEPHWFDEIFPHWSIDVFAIIASVAGWALVFALVGLTRATGQVKALLQATVMLGAAAVIYAGGALWQQRRSPSLAIVVANQTEARLSAADRAASAESLPAGSRVYILSERGDWVYCELPNKGLGWIPSAALEKVALTRS